MTQRKHVTESDLRSAIASLKQRVSEAWYDPRTWGSGGQAAQPAAPAAPAKPAAPKKAAKSDPNVKALQDKLIAAGAKIKADGIMGPATRAAQQQFPNVTTQTDAEKAAASAPGAGMVATPADAAAAAQPAAAPAAAPASAAPPAPAAAVAPTAQGTAAGYAPAAMAPAAPATPDNSQVATDDIPFDPTWGGTKAAPDTRTTAEKVLPNFMGGKAAPVAANQNATWNNSQQAAVSNKPAMAESAGYDEVQRLISLIHHK